MRLDGEMENITWRKRVGTGGGLQILSGLWENAKSEFTPPSSTLTLGSRNSLPALMFGPLFRIVSATLAVRFWPSRRFSGLRNSEFCSMPAGGQFAGHLEVG